MSGYILWTFGIIVGTAIAVAWFIQTLSLFFDGYYRWGVASAAGLMLAVSVVLGAVFWYADGVDKVPATGVVTDRQFSDPPKGAASWRLRITDPADLNEGWVRVTSSVFEGCQFGDNWPDCSVGKR